MSVDIKHVYGCLIKHRYQIIHPSYCSPLQEPAEKNHCLQKHWRGRKAPSTMLCFSPALSGMVKMCGRAVGLDSVQFTNRSLFRSRILLPSCIVCRQNGQQSSSAEMQCADLLTVLYKQFPALVMPDGPNFPYFPFSNTFNSSKLCTSLFSLVTGVE